MIRNIYITNGGSPATSLVPQFETLITSSNATDKLAHLTGSSNISFASATKKITKAAEDFAGDGFAAGQKLRVLGTTNNNGVFTIASVDTGEIVVSEALTNENNTSAELEAPAIEEIGGGFYAFNILFGTLPWDTKTENLLAVIDADPDDSETMAPAERYIPIEINVLDYAFVKIAGKGVQTKSSGDVIYYDIDGSTAIFQADMTNGSSTITRAPAAPS